MEFKYKICLAQLSSTYYDKKKNLEKIERTLSSASSKGAKIILFPEMFLSGYMVWDRLPELIETLYDNTICAIAKLAKQYKMIIVCGFPEKKNNKELPFNSAFLIDSNGSIIGAYQKTHLFDHEKGVYSPGENLKVFDTSLGKIGIIICYDCEFPETTRSLALQGAKLVLVPTANMNPYREYHLLFTRARAAENGIYLACANTIGNDGRFQYFGQSLVCDPTGRLLCLGSSKKEELLYADIDLSLIPHSDHNINYLAHRRPRLYGTLIE